MSLTSTLVTDGTSDRALVPIIEHVLSRLPEVAAVRSVVRFAGAQGGDLRERISNAMRFFPCDILFVHRDAEGAANENRIAEIANAAPTASCSTVPVVPVRMTEAWLLIDAGAIRRAADNPNGSVAISLPRPQDLEAVADPKDVLFGLLVAASEKVGRRLKQFRRDLPARRTRVASLIRDFSPLHQLPAFQRFQADTISAVKQWCEQQNDT